MDTKRTSGCGYRSTERNKRSDVGLQQLTHFLNELPSDTGVATNQGVHTNQDRTTHPSLGHTRGSERVGQGKRIGNSVDIVGQDTSLLMLQKSESKREWVICARIS